MAYRLRRFTKRFFIFSHLVSALVFLLACLAAFCNPVHYWFIALLGVGFVFFAVIILGFLIFWLLFRSRWAFLSVAMLVIGVSQIRILFPFHLFTGFKPEKPAGTLRVLTWNVARFDEMNKVSNGSKNNRLNILQQIGKEDADVVCIQEFFESRRSDLFDKNIPYFTDVLKYPYHYFAIDHITATGVYEHGIAIFSRHPILDSFRLRYPGQSTTGTTESLIRVTVDVYGRKLNIFTTHLQSFMFTGNEYRGLRTIKHAEDKDSVLQAGKGIAKKFRYSYIYRSAQADIVRALLDRSPYPKIICGDFNDIPNSYTYSTIKGDMQDAFVRQGFGLGRTFAFISPTLRIDYILADAGFGVLQCKKAKLPYSDHYPVVADFTLP